MPKPTKIKIKHAMWLMLLVIVMGLALSTSITQGMHLQAHERKEVNNYLLKDLKSNKINHYGTAKYYQKEDTIIFKAHPKIAKEINHTKIKDTAPIKYNKGIKHISKQLKEQAQISNLRMVLKAKHKKYIIEEK